MMGLAGAKRSKCPRVLSPFEIEGQRFNEDNITSQLLVAWYDFNDPSEMVSYESTWTVPPVDGERVGIISNKVKKNLVNNGASSDHQKALGGYLLASSASLAPYWHAPTDSSRGFARFDGVGNALFSSVVTPAVTGNFSSATIDMNNFMIVIVCKRDLSVSTYMNLLNIYAKDPNQIMNLGYLGISKRLAFNSIDFNDAADPSNGIVYDDADDGEFHYHIINGYPSYLTINTVAAMSSDGFWKVTDTYSQTSNTGVKTSTMEFDGIGHGAFVGLGCKKHPTIVDPHITQLFKGDIYELMIWKRDMDGGTSYDPNFDRNTHRDILHYLRRKYQYTRNTD